MPSDTVATQAGSSLLLPLISTRHKRHAPTSLKPVEMAERGNVDVVLARHFKNGLACAGAHFLSVDLQCFDFNGVSLMPTPPRELHQRRRSSNVADAGRAALVHDVFDVLVLEVLAACSAPGWAPSARVRKGWSP